MNLFPAPRENATHYGAIWNNSNGDMIAHGEFSSSHLAQSFVALALVRLVADSKYNDVQFSTEVKALAN